MSNYSEISNFIWNVCDDVLRGLFKQHEYGDVILPFTILRRLDCVLEPHKDEVYNVYQQYKGQVEDPTPIILNKINTTFYNRSKYDLTRLKSDPQNININFQNYLGGYSDNVVEIIENFQLEIFKASQCKLLLWYWMFFPEFATLNCCLTMSLILYFIST